MERSTPQTEPIDGRFALRERLGEGSVGSIWRAEEMPHGRPVALKVLRSEVADLPHLRRRFAREARAASRLRHPNIAAVIDYGVSDDGRMYIAMELLQGVLVSELIRRGLSLENLLEFSDQLLAGLAHAHARGVIHRDLKPGNLMVVDGDLPESFGTLKIVDFGIARLESDPEEGETAQDQVVGTPRYMSPEQAAGESQLEPATDLYNVGLILYEFIAGHPPFGDQKWMEVMSSHVHEEVPPLMPRPELEVPDELVDFVDRALRKDPDRRWASAAEMRRVVAGIRDAIDSEPGGRRVPASVSESVGELEPTIDERAATRPETTAVDTLEETAEFSTRQHRDREVVSARQRIPFVGRRQERRRLCQIVDRVRSRPQGTVVLMEGVAGVGKTRLTMWLKEWAEEEGLLRGHIGSFTRGNAEGMRGLREVLDSLFGTRGMGRSEVADRVEARLEQWGYDDAVDPRRLADFMRPGETDTSQADLLSPTKLSAAIARIFEMAAERRPRLIIFDDLHWAGPEVGEFLDHLAVEMRHREMPLMIIGTVRTEDLEANPGLANRLASLSRYVGETVERFDLERLDAESGRQLVRYVLPVDDDLADTIYERSGGNPLHLVLLVRYLRQEGLLEWDDGRWIPRDESAVRAAVPPSLADLFRVRVEQVESRHESHGRLEELLQRAAVAGPRFSYEVLLEMLQLEGDDDQLEYFDDDFDRLLSEGLLIESHGRREDWYAFSHGVVRDYFLDQIGGAYRERRFHRLAAKARENVAEEQTGAMASAIAEHWEAARHYTAALKWYLRATRTALRSTTLRQAATAAEGALRIMEELFEIDGGLDEIGVDEFLRRCEEAGVEPKTYAAVVVQLGDLYEDFGAYDRSEAYYRRIVRLVGSDPPEIAWVRGALAESWLGLGHLAWQRGDFEAAEWAFRRVRELVEGHAEGRDKLEEVGARAQRGLARVAWHRGGYDRAEQLAEEALESAKNRADDVGCAKATWLLGEVARIRGDDEIARQYFERSQDLYEKTDQRKGLARNLLSRAQLARYQKQFDRAEQLYRRALRRYQKLGNRRGTGQCFNGLGDVARFRGRYEEARGLYERALEIYEAIGAVYDVAVVYTNLGLTAMRREKSDAAKQYLEAARELVADEEYPYLQAGVEFNLALVEAIRGDYESSTEILERVFELADEFPIPDLDYAEPLEELGKLRSEEGRDEEALQLWERARDIYGELALTDDRMRLERMMSRELGE